MFLHEVMESDIATVSAFDYAVEALTLMRRACLERVFVLDRDEIAGVVFRHDLERQSEAALRDRDVREYMNTGLAMADAQSTLEEAERLMRRRRLVYLAVMQNKRLVGAVPIRDLPARSRSRLGAV